jgi:ubiquinone/menaquinone biosynthesis C-methylase UbiE
MSFDLLAPHYRWMELLLAGEKLQRCRTAFVAAIPSPQRVLMLGEGNGRCLVELLRAFPEAQLTCLDASQCMLDRARSRVQAQGLRAERVDFVHADVFDWRAPVEKFDLLVPHFFLDCFRADQLAQLIPRLSNAAAPGAQWLLADFRQPTSGVAKWRARGILYAMYLFFQKVTCLPASRLTPPDAFLRQSGFVLRERSLFEWGMLHSDLWQRER